MCIVFKWYSYTVEKIVRTQYNVAAAVELEKEYMERCPPNFFCRLSCALPSRLQRGQMSFIRDTEGRKSKHMYWAAKVMVNGVNKCWTHPDWDDCKKGGPLHLFPKQVELKNNDIRDVSSEDDFQIDLSDGTALCFLSFY